MSSGALIMEEVSLDDAAVAGLPVVDDRPALQPLEGADVPAQSIRYSYQPVDWRTRSAGAGGTAAVLLFLVVAAFVRLQGAPSIVSAPRTLAVVNLERLEAPADPVREVPEGPEQVQQDASKAQAYERSVEVPLLRPPLPGPPAAQPVERSVAAEAVPETSAPRSIPAPPANRAAINVAANWQAIVMAHLEKHRRYPAAARARGQQGVAQVAFRMNRRGQVLTVRISRTSGSATLDRAAIDTVKRAQPLPAIPDDMPDELDLAVEVEFFTR